MRRYFSLITAFTFMIACAAGVAKAADATLSVTFKYTDGGGIEHPLENAYVYLRDAAVQPPMEKYFSPADYIYGTTDAAGQMSVVVPQGEYYVRLTRRNQAPVNRPWGPPEPGDYSYTPVIPITIGAAGATLNVNNAGIFGSPITITGEVKDYLGNPVAGSYVRIQTEACIKGDYTSPIEDEWVDSNQCGPDKFMAQKRTDAEGKFTILLRNPGDYFLVVSRTIGDHHTPGVGNVSTMGYQIGPSTFNANQNLTINLPHSY